MLNNGCGIRSEAEDIHAYSEGRPKGVQRNMNMNKYYHAIHEPAPVHVTIEPPRLSWKESFHNFCSYMERTRDYIGQSPILGPIFCGLVCIFLIYVAIIVIAILFIGFNTATEATIVYLFGRAVYNKNFPVCTYTQYSGGNNCYTTTSTYCT